MRIMARNRGTSLRASTTTEISVPVKPVHSAGSQPAGVGAVWRCARRQDDLITLPQVRAGRFHRNTVGGQAAQFVVAEDVSHLADRNVDSFSIRGAGPQPLAIVRDVDAPDQRHRVLRTSDAAEVRLHGSLAFRWSGRLRPLPEDLWQDFWRPAKKLSRRPQNLRHTPGGKVHGSSPIAAASVPQSLEYAGWLFTIDRPGIGTCPRITASAARLGRRHVHVDGAHACAFRVDSACPAVA